MVQSTFMKKTFIEIYRGRSQLPSESKSVAKKLRNESITSDSTNKWCITDSVPRRSTISAVSTLLNRQTKKGGEELE